MTETQTSTTTQVHRVWIKASVQRVWDAITDAEWNGRYGYGAPSQYDLRPGGLFLVRPSAQMIEFGANDPLIDGEVVEADPPTRLVQTWHARFNDETIAEPASRLTWELADVNGVTTLTVTHELIGAPATASFTDGSKVGEAGGGWPFLLSDLKTFLETGRSMAGA
jgi:uncharacterized protein YndB with AHSA1/START domain